MAKRGPASDADYMFCMIYAATTLIPFRANVTTVAHFLMALRLSPFHGIMPIVLYSLYHLITIIVILFSVINYLPSPSDLVVMGTMIII